MALAVLQNIAGQNSGNPLTLTLPAPTTAGNSIIVVMQAYVAASTPTIADDKLNSYGAPILAKYTDTGEDSYIVAWMVTPATAGTQVITLHSTNGFENACAYEISGGNPITLQDHATATTPTSVNSSMSAGPVNVGVGNLLLYFGGTSFSSNVGAVATDGTWTVDGNPKTNGTSGLFVSKQIVSGTTATGSVGLSPSTSAKIASAALSFAPPTNSISGNAGVASANVAYSGTMSGSVTADGSGNYTISGLIAGSYTITPSLTGYSFSPTSANETISGSNITGVNFTATHLTVATSTFSPVAGTYAGAQTITLNNTNSGLAGFAQYYTTDGSTPTTGSTLYTTPFSLPDSATVKVLAVATGYINSAIASAAYVITWSVSGSAGAAATSIAYTGPSSGTVTADGSGNYTISGLVDGTYTLTPTLTGYTFVPVNQVVVVSGANQSGVNFTANLAIYSQPDCRVTKPNSATFEIVNQTKIYDVQTSSNPAIAPVDSRVSKPVACGTYPQNSRNPNKYNN